MSKPFAIFTTSDIQRLDTREHTIRPVSFGRLERAIGSGFQCLVATTRSELGPHDEWWVELVGKENVFLAKDRAYLCDNHHETIRRDRWGTVGNYCASTGWSRLYDRLMEQWPRCEGKPEHWTAARARLRDLGYASGKEFNNAFLDIEELKLRLDTQRASVEHNQSSTIA